MTAKRRKLDQATGQTINNCKIVDGYYLKTRSGKNRLYVICECLKCHNQFEIRYDTLNHLHGDNCPQCNIKAYGKRCRKPVRDHKLWQIWWAMKTRCYKETSHMYKNYGARDITVCQEWLDSYENFYEWSISNGYGAGLSLDRIDDNGNYEPFNCQWVDQKTQANNTRRVFFLWYQNKWRQVEEIAKLENISYDKAYYKYVTNKKTRLPRKQLYDIDNIKK